MDSIENKLCLNVLLVDDDAIVGNLLKRYFRTLGIKLDLAYNGRTALKKIQKKKYDSIILDIQMPEMDGFEVLGRLRNLGCLAPVAAFTAMDFQGTRQRFKSAGFTDVFSKNNGFTALTRFVKKSE